MMLAGGPILEVPLVRHTTCCMSTRVVSVSLVCTLLVKFERDELDETKALRQKLERKLGNSLE